MASFDKMKLYVAKGAPNPRLVEMYLAEKGLTLPTQEVSIMKGEHKRDAYKKISPLSQVPALDKGDGTYLTETIAICRYFETLHPEPSLFGSDADTIAEIEMWRRRLELLLFINAAFSFRHLHPAMAELESQIQEFGELCKTRTLKMLHWFDRAMEGREFIAADRFSIADIAGLIGMDFAIHAARVPIPDEAKNLQGWHDRLSKRPSAQV